MGDAPGTHSRAAAAPASADLPPAPGPQLPVVDLIGLRFSLQHLRLVGYGLLAVWLSEIVNLLSSPGVAEIGSRLHYISQFLDLSPILLVAIGLIAYQGGLRRSPLEAAALPLLLCLLPLLSALHFFLAPVSVANAVTLMQKQEQIGRSQLERIDRQIDRASTILRDSDSIEALLSGLQRIPGLQVQVPPDAAVDEARQQVRQSLQRERNRVRERIESNLSGSRDAFLRRAITNAVLALLVGVLLWALHRGAMREMELAIPFLDWVLVQGEASEQPEVLQGLLRFQRACVALGWFAMGERLVRLARRVVRRPSLAELAAEEEQQRQRSESPPPNPFEGRSAPRRPSRPPGPLGSWSGLPGAADSLAAPFLPASDDPDSERPGQPWLEPAGAAAEDADDASRPAAAGASDPIRAAIERSQQARQQREERRRQRDLERYRARREWLERSGADAHGLFGFELQAEEAGRSAEGDDDGPGLPPDRPEGPPRRRGLAALWHWFLTHL